MDREFVFRDGNIFDPSRKERLRMMKEVTHERIRRGRKKQAMRCAGAVDQGRFDFKL